MTNVSALVPITSWNTLQTIFLQHSLIIVMAEIPGSQRGDPKGDPLGQAH